MNIFATKSVQENRKSICDKCDNKITGKKMDRCGACKCPLGGKIRLNGASCPLRKW